MNTQDFTGKLKIALLAGGAIILPASAMAQQGTATADGAVTQGDLAGQIDTAPGDEIVVTGFRQSLDAAIAAKRNSASQVDVIVAEDIAKFPDTNLAESLQRVPGVSIQREAGEGRAITVRGLGQQFTRVRVNGMEAVATSTSDASANRERGFDFNVFAAELFSSLVVHKTAEASLDEGSLGAVVDLNTGNPLALDAGFSAVASAQVRYNDLSEDAGPRLAGLLGWTNDDGTFGVSVSAAYSQYKTSELGNNSVRWTQGAFRSVSGTSCFTGTTYTPNSACNAVGLAFHPRIPRYGAVEHDRERLGLTGSVQWAPTDRTKLSIDGLYSTFKASRDEYWGELLFRTNERSIDVVDYQIDADNNLISGTFNNAWVRTERYSRESETKFHQLSGRLEHEFSDRVKIDLLGGFSKSEAPITREATLIFDDRDFNGYSYDYSDMDSPQLSFGTNGISDPAQFQLAEFRNRPSDTTNKFKTVSGNIDWQATDELNFEIGGVYRQFDFDTIGYRADSTYCVAFTCRPGQYGLPVTGAISELFELGNAGQPAGNTNQWVVPLLGPAADAVGLFELNPAAFPGDTRSVTEKTTGGYVQANWDSDFFGLRFTGNLGLRYVRTDQSSTGFVGTSEVTVERDYDDFLPALNVNLFVTDDVILRGAMSRVITRPSLGGLTPGGSIDPFNFRITTGNPFLDPFRAWAYDAAVEWYFAPGALASVAVFSKEIDNFPIAGSQQGTFADSQLPTSLLTPGTPLYEAIVGGTNPGVPIEYRTQVNNPGGSLRGVEFSLNLPFSTFTDSTFLGGFGLLGNVTLIDSNVEYTVPLPGTGLDRSGNPTGASDVFERPLLDMAKRAANGTLYWENDKFSVRTSLAWRDEYIDGISGNRNVFEGFEDILNVDASIRYNVTEQLSVTLEGTNLTDAARKRWVDDFARRGYENNRFGRIIMAGVRVQL
ncbi:TonB-dependent receptor [Croceibacterium mercuriale]|uniref:TonB-dependent receptor n=1 Tax=Croceibacterium mercuriale TaxID=1572751 RepID=A0A0B2BZH8_9SPHN|nr:TonB-dependent receptor [Croceibacterium mercuriale]KHL25106.1 TonB-dependent receptor [Croceibacterium mercuriale]